MKRQKIKESNSIKNRMANVTTLPKDVLLGMPLITMTGQAEVCIENHRGIIEYTEVLIRIKTKIGQIKINGKKLQIEYYTNDEMKIIGRIESVDYC